MSVDLSLFFTTDEEGNEQELPRPESKSWADVGQCIKHNKGQPLPVVDRFIELAGLTDQWAWLDRYNDWMAECERIQILNADRVPDEETGEMAEPYPLPEMPERPALVDLAQWKLDHYAMLRRAAYGTAEQQLALLADGQAVWDAHCDTVRQTWPKAA